VAAIKKQAIACHGTIWLGDSSLDLDLRLKKESLSEFQGKTTTSEFAKGVCLLAMMLGFVRRIVSGWENLG